MENEVKGLKLDFPKTSEQAKNLLYQALGQLAVRSSTTSKNRVGGVSRPRAWIKWRQINPAMAGEKGELDEFLA